MKHPMHEIIGNYPNIISPASVRGILPFKKDDEERLMSVKVDDELRSVITQSRFLLFPFNGASVKDIAAANPVFASEEDRIAEKENVGRKQFMNPSHALTMNPYFDDRSEAAWVAMPLETDENDAALPFQTLAANQVAAAALVATEVYDRELHTLPSTAKKLVRTKKELVFAPDVEGNMTIPVYKKDLSYPDGNARDGGGNLIQEKTTEEIVLGHDVMYWLTSSIHHFEGRYRIIFGSGATGAFLTATHVFTGKPAEAQGIVLR